MCPIKQKDCKGCKYLKEEMCDHPYAIGMSEEIIRGITQAIKRRVK